MTISRDELDDEQDAWEAFRYVDGQMTADEESAFEGRLGHEQPLREAVARVVQTTIAVRTIAAEPVRTIAAAPVGRIADPLVPARRRSLVAAVAVLSLLVAVAVVTRPWGWIGSTGGPGGEVGIDDDVFASIDAGRARDLVALWTRGTSTEDSADPPDDDADVLGTDVLGTDDDETFVVPGWMLAAVAPTTLDGMRETLRPDGVDPSAVPGVEN